MAPELILRESYTTAVDILTLGATVVEMADGSSSFADKSSFTAMLAIALRQGPFLFKPDEAHHIELETISWRTCRACSHICCIASSTYCRDEGRPLVDAGIRSMKSGYGGRCSYINLIKYEYSVT